MLTIYDLAKHCNVSPTTVSLVMNGSPRKVSPATRSRVLEAAKALNYRPNSAARKLNRRTMSALGMLLPWRPEMQLRNPYFGALMASAMSAATDARQCVTIFPANLLDDMDEFDAIVSDGRIDGLLIIYPGVNQDILERLVALTVPKIFVNSSPAGYGVSYVDCDHAQGAYLACSHLTRLGHRKIAAIMGQEEFPFAKQRLDGYERALVEAGIDPRSQVQRSGQFEWFWGHSAALELLRLPADQRPTAIFCGSDAIATGSLKAASELGLSVPRDLSIIGFDDVITAAETSPPLTTISQNLQMIGAASVTHLLESITNRQSDPVQQIIQPCLVVRATTAPPLN